MNIPSPVVSVDLSFTALVDGVDDYFKIYGEMPMTLMYDLGDEFIASELRYGPQSYGIRSLVHYWVAVPGLEGWILSGPKGIYYSPGA